MAQTLVAPPPTEHTQDTSDRSRWIALYVLCLGMLMIILDGTIVNVALPAIQTDLGFSQSSLAWVVNAYLIPFGGLLLLAGRLGDLIGGKQMFISGMVVFILASALCGFAQTQEMLIGARFLQGVGGAMGSAVILGMIIRLFPEAREQAKAIGIYAFVASAGGSIGLLAGGVLTDALSWHWIFFVNLPIGVLAAVAGWRVVQREEGLGLSAGADLPGALLITSSLMLTVYTIVGAAENGWASLHTLGLFAVALVLLGGFVAREATAKNPMVPLRVFRSRNTSGANVIQILLVAGLFGMFFVGALYLQRVLGYSAVEVGLAFLPIPVGIGGLSLGLAEKLIMRFGPRALMRPGLALAGVALLLLARAPVDGSYLTDVFPSMVLLGVGAGLTFPAMITVAMSEAAPEDAGLASGLVNTTQQVGGALGLAVLATLSTTRTSGLLENGESRAEALVGGYHLAFVLGAAFLLTAVVLSFTVLTRGAEPELEISEVEDLEPVEIAEAA